MSTWCRCPHRAVISRVQRDPRPAAPIFALTGNTCPTMRSVVQFRLTSWPMTAPTLPSRTSPTISSSAFFSCCTPLFYNMDFHRLCTRCRSLLPGLPKHYHWWIHCSPWSSSTRCSSRLHSWPSGLQRSILLSGPVTHHCSSLSTKI